MMNNEEKYTAWQTKFTLLQQKSTLDAETEKFISEILSEFSAVQGQNERLRKIILQKTTGDSRMSTKLRDALYE
ncbi:hypothetical protein [Paenibacillus sp. Marseille-Q4541]|uniref:hypothetical protein n=1 Tax=Paenibacillus sp. Marseille-Q4541 TaxID=2831522 RepID=UPI001BA47E29|nr:hypothetical protein [Paenibacillus sp. Marseille-Q4541]